MDVQFAAGAGNHSSPLAPLGVGAEDYYDDTEDTSERDYYIISGVVMSLVAAVGVLGNALSLFILTRPRMRSPINLYLTWLGLYDTAGSKENYL